MNAVLVLALFLEIREHQWGEVFFVPFETLQQPLIFVFDITVPFVALLAIIGTSEKFHILHETFSDFL